MMERCRCWCPECDRGFVITVSMRAMKDEEERAERGQCPLEDAPMLVPVDAEFVAPGPEFGEIEELAAADPMPDAKPRRVNEVRRAGRSRVPVSLPPEVDHGSRYAYERYGCRCDPCTDEQAESARRHRQARTARAS